MNPCSSNLQKEDIILQIRDLLRKNNVKLWLPPYYNEKSGSSQDDLKVTSLFCLSFFNPEFLEFGSRLQHQY